MARKSKIFLAVYSLIAILASFSIYTYIVNNLERQFITTMEKNSLLFQDRVIKVDDILELQGKKANFLINLDDFADEFANGQYADMISFLSYDEKNDMFNFDNIQNSDVDITKISNITGKGNLDFLNDKNNLKTLEIYLLLFMNNDFAWINNKLESSHWVYYTSLNQMTSIRVRSGEFVKSEDFTFSDEMLGMSFVTDGYKEKLDNRQVVYWSSPYVDLAGDGLMITASYPVDYKGEYIGSISSDFKSNMLSKILAEKYTTFIVDSKGVMLATNVKDFDLTHELKTVEDLPINLTYDDIKDIEVNEVVKVKGDRVVAHNLIGSPYILYQVYSREAYLIDAIIDFFPIVLIFIFFAITSLMLHRVRESEVKLKETLSELESKQEELDYISKYDTLTNIYNRRGLYSELKYIEGHGALIGSSVIIFDIDHFKQVNDTYGHDVGDYVLTELCDVVKTYISENEIFARYGGEEFIIISKGTELEKTCELAEKIRVGIANHKFETIENLTVSLGVSTFRSKDTNDTWIKIADDALYKAKSDGRNKVYYYENYELIGYSDKLKK